MGQKVTPVGFRLGITYKPQSQWFVDPRSGSMKKIYPPLILEDKFIRDFITQKFPRTAIAQILIFRTLDYIKIEIHTAQAKKLSYQSTNKKNDSQTEPESASSSRERGNRDSSSVENLKNLQQDLQIALLKYKKTLQIFSSWKNHCFSKNNKPEYREGTSQNYEKTNLLEDETQELPKLWSYEASNFRVNKTPAGADNNLQKELDALPQENSTSPTQADLSETSGLLNSSNSSQLEANDQKNNDGIQLNTFSEKENATQHIGIVVKQLNQPFQYASIFTKYLVSQLERRDTSVKQALDRSLRLIQSYKLQGIKIKVSGRLNGVDMAETQNIIKGRIPLSTISAKIDYYHDIAQTLHGTLGVKVFIYR